ncbi:MAG: ORF6N domain-containing protein [Candidatus Marinimicrobia bacterium]|jgi:uncharacterized membrane-anchored protein YjiN (DUF445 family)|nr:ORF6N domain-containing protein [Candidatus Neomarinimicrobiota bacterium]MDP6935849.1 ORF6N domain-containing protein [Candidatus Neomarinimicrobiota bacterium]
MPNNSDQMLPIVNISSKILLIRGKKVMLDRDLAKLYGVDTSRLNEQVSRNIDRFPEDFMFRLNREEFKLLKSHFATSSWGGTRKPPRIFTEQGVAMLSGVLRSKRAIEVNILIMRAFVKMRELLYTDKTLALKVEKLEQDMKIQGKSLNQVIELVNRLLNQPGKKQRKIGFRIGEN